eukprot:CAMPEP_0171306990 /NCGR_PEP_ID=MMETSP0816-20121228/17034_1 /TAXON_ID=420281 /ORGANISM="Proboscia inermis, Strain CCAP1064/1" /LENGTH=194 /DNA_ID=CAMNT_0011788925 /DNA_START=141 /DNA_END=725 /DNA_ORIENTATION=-
MRSISFFIVTLGLLPALEAFSPSITTRTLFGQRSNSNYILRRKVEPLSPTKSSNVSRSMSMIPIDDISSVMNTASNLIATIDSDIAAIPENEFKTVFMGGIAVMTGGVFSALIVGALLEVGGGTNYGRVIGESYAQAGDDEEFLSTLTPEQRVQAEEALAKFRESKNKSGEEKKEVVMASASVDEKDDSMFSDY